MRGQRGMIRGLSHTPFTEASPMAKSKARKGGQHPHHNQPEADMPDEETQKPIATAVEEQPQSGGEERKGGGGGGSDDISAIDAETNAKYEQVKSGKLYIKDLQQMDIHQLHEIAKSENIQDYIGLKKQDLIFQILRARIRQNGLMYGEGVLEILPDGFGFLRSPEYNYLPCPDDIYISPSQIRRFGLRNGHVVQGQIR